MHLMEVNQLIKAVEREVWVVTAADGDRRGGLLATFVSPISIVPTMPRLAVALSKQHHTWGLVSSSRALTVHLLTEQQVDLGFHFGTRSGRNIDKLADVPFRVGQTGSPVLADARAWLECKVETCFDTGDRTIFLAEVVAGAYPAPFPALTQRQLIQQATPEQLQELRDQMAADAEVDAAAIVQWREALPPRSIG